MKMKIYITAWVLLSLTVPSLSNSPFYVYEECKGGDRKSFKEYFTEFDVSFEPEVPRSGADAFVTITSYPFKSYYARSSHLKIEYKSILGKVKLWEGDYELEQECIMGAPCVRTDYFPSKWALPGIYYAETIIMDQNNQEIMCSQVTFKLSGPLGKDEFEKLNK